MTKNNFACFFETRCIMTYYNYYLKSKAKRKCPLHSRRMTNGQTDKERRTYNNIEADDKNGSPIIVHTAGVL